MKRWVSFLLSALLVVVLLPSGISVSAATVDLELTDFNWNTATEVTPGTLVTFSVTIKNKSNALVNDALAVTFGTVDTTFETVNYSGGIAAGSSVTIKSQPWKAVAGDHLVVATINATNTVSESTKANNTKLATLRVANGKLASAHSSTQTMIEECGITTLIFSEDFNDLSSVDTTNSGKIGYKWYVARPYGAKTLTTDDYSVKNGVMSVHNITPTYNYGLGTYNHSTKVGFTYNTGYMEIRLRIPRPRENTSTEKGVPAIWALPPEKLTNQARKWVETDWMEYWGINAYNSDWPDGFYTVCLHEQHLTGTTVTTHYKNTNYMLSGLGDAEWHVMGWLWQEGLFITYLDGVEVMRQTYGANIRPNPIASMIKGDSAASKIGVYSMLDTQYNPIIIGGSKDNPMELDYVRVWNGARTANPGVVTTPEATAKEFLSIYTTNDEGDPIKTVTEDTYSYLLAGEREWNTMDSATKAVIDAMLAKNGQPTFAQLLAQAKKIQSGGSVTTTTKTTTTTRTTKGSTTTRVTATATTTTRLTSGGTVPSSSGTVTTSTATGGTTVAGMITVETIDTTASITATTQDIAETKSESKEQKTESSKEMTVIVAIAVLALALLGVMIWVITKRKKK